MSVTLLPSKNSRGKTTHSLCTLKERSLEDSDWPSLGHMLNQEPISAIRYRGVLIGSP
jgi:hypothetical protein